MLDELRCREHKKAILGSMKENKNMIWVGDLGTKIQSQRYKTKALQDTSM